MDLKIVENYLKNYCTFKYNDVVNQFYSLELIDIDIVGLSKINIKLDYKMKYMGAYFNIRFLESSVTTKEYILFDELDITIKSTRYNINHLSIGELVNLIREETINEILK